MSALKIMYWNAQGMYGKFNELVELLRVEEIDIACISETHLTSNMTLKDIPNYHTIRKDRITHLGGLVTLIKQNIKFEETDCGQTGVIEYSATSILEGNTKFILCNTYLPGGARSSEIKLNFKKDLQNLLSYNNNHHGVIMVGDINAKHKSWNNPKNNAAGNILYKFSQTSNYLVAFPPDPTYVPMTNKKKPSTIDLLISNGVISTSRPYTKNILTSDHVPVFTRVHITHRSSTMTSNNRPNFFKTNWKAFRETLDHTIRPYFDLLTYDRINNSDIDKAVSTITKATKGALESNVPLEKTTREGTFVTDEIKALIKKRNYYRQRWMRHRRASDKDNYTEIHKDVRNKIHILNNNRLSEQLMSCTIGDNKLYKIIKRRKRNSTLPPLYSDSNSSRIYSDMDKATVIAKHFREMHNNTLTNNDPLFATCVSETVKKSLSQPFQFEEEISSGEVFRTIKSLKNGKTPGHDQIPTIAVKNLSHMGYEYLTRIYNGCLRNGYYPKDWKISRTIAVPKPGKDPNDRKSYRPISLLCTYSKVFEKLITKRVNITSKNYKVIPDIQFGFRAEHSTNHPLVLLHSSIKAGLKEKRTTGVLSFDIEKAFDRIWHDGLIYKLIKFKFPSYLIHIISSFVRDRSFYVQVGGAASPLQDIPFGLPQGSALSPVLYNIYIADIPTDFGEDTKLKLYADDTIIETSDRKIANINKRLKDAAQTIYKYYNKWKIKINTEKTVLACFTYRKTKQLPDATLSINGTDIPWTKELKYLGITFDSRLTMKRQTLDMCNKVDAAISLLYPYINYHSQLDEKLKVHIYRTYLRPILTYAIPVMQTMSKTGFKILERKQNKCLRMLLAIPWESRTSNKIVHQRANLPTIREFANRQKLSFVRKCRISNNPVIKAITL